MLLENNTEKVIKLLNQFDDLKDIEKIRLAIHILENKNFNTDYNVNSIIIVLKKALNILDINSTNIIINFSKYKNLLFISSKYLELSTEEKKYFSVEILFNIHENDFHNDFINTLINEELLIYEYCYNLIYN